MSHFQTKGWLPADGNNDANCYCDEEARDIGAAETLPELVTDAYADGILDGYYQLTTVVVEALREALASNASLNPNNYDIDSCGVFIDDFVAGRVDPTDVCEFPDGCDCSETSDNFCNCTAEVPLCLMITNIEVVSPQPYLTFEYPTVTEGGATIVETKNWTKDRVDVEFIISSTEIITDEDNRALNEMIGQALKNSLIAYSGSSSFMHAQADDWSATDGWNAILHPEIDNSDFIMGYNLEGQICSTSDGSNNCGCDANVQPQPIPSPDPPAEEDDTVTYALIGVGGAAIVAAVATAAYMKSNAAMMSHLQVYQKEVFYEALNRNRATDVRLLDVTDNPSYTVDPDNLGV